jgi:ABC-type oligopeptide transport system substrate-binding subunit
MKRTKTFGLFGAAVLALSLTPAACGDDDEETPEGETTETTVAEEGSEEETTETTVAEEGSEEEMTEETTETTEAEG